ncbi:MAG: serine/threonine-protein phosphatase [Verrucomicrobia bacterium]|nr:MAG: serine/threonine-protein phosphatase [Verrucomicrobiota bacterium]
MMQPTNSVPATKKCLQWSAETDRGKIRTNNEDSFLCIQFDAREVRYLGKTGQEALDTTDYVFAVSDGMGGALAGEYASRIAVEKITLLLPNSFRHSVTGFSIGFQDVLTELFTEIHRALLYLGQSYAECAGMGTTLSLCWFTPTALYFAHIGDSRIYYLPAGGGVQIRQLTHDDTHVGWLLRSGKITEQQARIHPWRHSLQRVLGSHPQSMDFQLGAVKYEPGDCFVLCTDGLTDGLFESQIVELLRHPNSEESQFAPAKRLVQASLMRSGRDNTTAVVVQVI